MKKLIPLVQISLDGFVADVNGTFDLFIGGEENLSFVCGITDTADAALFGRVSYQLLNGDWPTAANKPGATKGMIKYSNWYNRVDKFVLSGTLQQADIVNATVINNNIAEEVNAIKNSGNSNKDMLIFGSPSTVHTLLELHLIDGFWLIVHPVLFGTGIPLFRDSASVTSVNLLHTTTLTNGTIIMKYEVAKL